MCTAPPDRTWEEQAGQFTRLEECRFPLRLQRFQNQCSQRCFSVVSEYPTVRGTRTAGQILALRSRNSEYRLEPPAQSTGQSMTDPLEAVAIEPPVVEQKYREGTGTSITLLMIAPQPRIRRFSMIRAKTRPPGTGNGVRA